MDPHQIRETLVALVNFEKYLINLLDQSREYAHELQNLLPVNNANQFGIIPLLFTAFQHRSGPILNILNIWVNAFTTDYFNLQLEEQTVNAYIHRHTEVNAPWVAHIRTLN